MDRPLGADFFDRDASEVARSLLGKVLRRRWGGLLLAAAVVEAEAYFLAERGSHASLGRTPGREALWSPPGTVYMYWSRGGDSLNVSCRGDGDAVLFKAARTWIDDRSPEEALQAMIGLNPIKGAGRPRLPARLCSGQTLLCRSLALRVRDWNGRPFEPGEFWVEDAGYRPASVVVTTRLGIPPGRDEDLMYRFIDLAFADCATSNPLRRRGWREGREYAVVEGGAGIGGDACAACRPRIPGRR